MASLTSRHIWMYLRPSIIRVSLSGRPGSVWWLITPLNTRLGKEWASLASSTPWSTARMPPRPIDVFTSITTPTVAPLASAISDSSRTLRGSSTVTFTSARRARAHTRSSLSEVGTSLVMRMSSMPPSIIASASAVLAVHTPPTVPPARICIRASIGVLMSLECSRILHTVSA